ncbi:hypothetical protein ACIAD2710 [Acinetobacter baylyi ADP1]|uniref:Uncharacterized protein n=1 Tax=Acinetobacter baylyi (strain ATCC 33305 / BD413 / ADP1) TaxID=62977 RepID=Q6F904_ACIAD|nr:hypothetical protein [Acinetobacter baylyi]ENV53384.1 hypothetical protein F952_02445 [Acinetobacter baylyi DSM 14961 = CIP 107474]CAG69461.1 hypothetical protein ACIAD2710 [Acinetobacter baylyi ADP1]
MMNKTIIALSLRKAFRVGTPSVETVKFNFRFPGQYYDEVTNEPYTA